ncbi:MAG: hypothetical protein H7832_00005 [Magnetococcus sp. DMHC-6]
MNKSPAAKRFLIAIGLGGIFGLVCVGLAAHHQPDLASLTHPIFWSIFTDRLLIGVVVALAGAYLRHPMFGFPFRPWLRGGCLGAMVSLPLAAGAMGGAAPTGMSLWVIFWATFLVGGVYGAIIDIVATRVGGEGTALLKVTDSL